MKDRLPPHQFALIRALADAPEDRSIEALAQASGTDQALISAAALELEAEGFTQVEERKYSEIKLGEDGSAIAAGEAVFPERLVARAVRERGGSAAIRDLTQDAALSTAGINAGQYARSLAELGWATFEKGTITLTGEATKGEPEASDPEAAIAMVHEAGGSVNAGDDADPRLIAGAQALKNNKKMLTLKERSRRYVNLTAEGGILAAAVKDGSVTEQREANELTPEMLLDGSWRDVQFRAYDVTLAAETVRPGKQHPLVRIIDEVRLAFLELGFSEANCQMAETAFWDFDALFQPQDHPAREMQDTFYLSNPASYSLPDGELVETVRRTHEDGGDTGSLGWRYKWSEQRAAQVVLRTHMTASSIEAIARNPKAPQKIFSIGRVFRRETVDNTHLPEFQQVDGIIIDEHGSLASLMGTLRKFYERLGIPEVKMKPAFFPYTEPSVEVHVNYRGKWMEMGGAGIFRPEVTQPFGCTAPVLAWGLGLERLAMARYNIPNIRQLYMSDLGQLRDTPLEG